MIKTILRSHGGAFDDFVPIREYELAKRIGKQRAAVVDMLEHLQQLEMLSYLPQTDSPKLQFLLARIDNKRLHIDSGYIRERKMVKQGQLDAVFAYLDGTGCRSKQLLAYFDEHKRSEEHTS